MQKYIFMTILVLLMFMGNTVSAGGCFSSNEAFTAELTAVSVSSRTTINLGNASTPEDVGAYIGFYLSVTGTSGCGVSTYWSSDNSKWYAGSLYLEGQHCVSKESRYVKLVPAGTPGSLVYASIGLATGVVTTSSSSPIPVDGAVDVTITASGAAITSAAGTGAFNVVSHPGLYGTAMRDDAFVIPYFLDNNDVDGSYEVISSTGPAWSTLVLPSTAAMTFVSSSANDSYWGTGLQKLTVVYATATSLVSEYISLSGTTAVTTSEASYGPIYIGAYATGTGNGPAGTITCTSGGYTLGTLAANEMVLSTYFYAVPTGYRLVLETPPAVAGLNPSASGIFYADWLEHNGTYGWTFAGHFMNSLTGGGSILEHLTGAVLNGPTRWTVRGYASADNVNVDISGYYVLEPIK